MKTARSRDRKRRAERVARLGAEGAARQRLAKLRNLPPHPREVPAELCWGQPFGELRAPASRRCPPRPLRHHLPGGCRQQSGPGQPPLPSSVPLPLFSTGGGRKNPSLPSCRQQGSSEPNLPRLPAPRSIPPLPPTCSRGARGGCRGCRGSRGWRGCSRGSRRAPPRPGSQAPGGERHRPPHASGGARRGGAVP